MKVQSGGHPHDPGKLIGNALSLYKAGDIAGAEAIYIEVLQFAPRHADALNLYGCLCDDTGRVDEGISLVTRSTEINPLAYPYFYNLANMLAKQGRAEEAIENYQTAVRLKPDYAVAYNNLGLTLRKQGRRAEAKLCFEKATKGKPRYADPFYNLSIEQKLQGDVVNAVAACREAIGIRPAYAEAHFSLAHTYALLQRPLESISAYRESIRLQPESALSFNNMGAELLKLGRVEEAVAAFQEALRIDPINAHSQGNLLLATCYASSDPAKTWAQAVEWERKIGAPLRCDAQSYPNQADPDRRLRIGYVSADFREHAAAYWLEPLLAKHQHQDFEVFCYSNSSNSLNDAVTDRLKGFADVWIECASLSDDALAAQIRQDGIDVLVDLSGHTDGNRLLVFARQPAPVQLSWFGFPASTGLKTMHYRLSDAVLDPPGESERYYSEKLVRLSRFYAAFTPDPCTPAVGKAPLERNGFVTFASLNSLAKITPSMLSLWAEILTGAPDSRLILQAAGLDGDELQQQIHKFFMERGVAKKRISLRGWIGINDFLRIGGEADIALDPYPFNGGVTTCHALWMGLPVVTMSGKSAASRVGRSILSRMNMEGLVAETPAQYRDIALGLAMDHSQIALMRATLRDRMNSSGLLDGAALAHEVEAAYRTMWRAWCDAI